LFYKRKLISLILLISFLLIGGIFAQSALKSLVGIQVEDGSNGSININIYFSTTSVPKYDIKQSASKIMVTFYDTQIKTVSKNVEINKGFLTNLEFSQNKNNTLLVINFVGSLPKYSVASSSGIIKIALSPSSVSSQEGTSYIKEASSIENTLLDVKIDKNYKPNLIVLEFSFEAPDFKSFLLKNPLRYVIDLNNTVNKLGSKVISVNSSPIISVRLSQFSTKPFITRVVVDLKTSFPAISAKSSDNKVYIGTSEVLAKVVPTTTKTISKKTIEVPEKEETPKITEIKTKEVQEEQKEETKLEQPKPVEVKDKFQQKISVSFDRAEIRDVLKAMGQLAGLNIITDIGVQGRISVYLKDIPFRDAFYALLASSDLGYVQQGEVIIVANLDKLQKIESRDLVTKVYQLRYFESQKAKEILSKTSKTAIFDSDDTRNWLIVSAPPTELPKIENAIKILDIPSERVAETKGVGKVQVEKYEDTYLVSLNAKGEDIKDILQEIAQKTGRNIIFSKDVSGGLYLTLNKVSLDRAIDLIIRSLGYTYEIREGGFIIVSVPKSETPSAPILEIKELVKIDKIGDIYYVTADLRKSDIRDILQEIAKKTEFNFVIDPKVSGSVDLFVNRVPLDEVLTILQRLANFDMEKVGKTYYVKPKEVQTAPTVVQPIITKLYVLKYIDLQDILRVGGALVKNISLSYDSKTRLLIAQGKEEDLKVLDDLISRIDVERKGEEVAVAKELLNVEKDKDGKIYVSCDLKKADIREVLRELGKKADINFVIDPKVTGEVDLYLNRVELSEVLNILQKAAKISITRDDKVTYVKMQEEKVAVPVETAKTKIYVLKYIDLSDIERVGGALVKNISLSYDSKTRLLIAQGKEEDLKVLDDLISRIDVERKGEEVAVAKELLNVEKDKDGKIYVSCDLKKADIREVLRELGKKADINFVIDPKVTGEVDLYLNRVELQDTIDILSRIGNITFEKMGVVTYVRPYVPPVVTAKEGVQTITKEYKLKYISLDTLKSVVSGLAKDVSFYYDQTSGFLLVQGPVDQVTAVENMIARLDKPTPQVKVDVQIVEVSRENVKDIGIAWGTQNISTGIKIEANVGWQDLKLSIINPESVLATIKALESQNKAKILAQPSMTTISGKATRIMIGDRVPLVSYDAQGNRSINYIDVGIILEVTPTINPDGTITANIKPQVSTISGYAGKEGDVPIISTREAQTIVNLKNGETLALGGLLRQEEIESMSKVPLLGDIPILGELFKARKTQNVQKELIILITPKTIE